MRKMVTDIDTKTKDSMETMKMIVCLSPSSKKAVDRVITDRLKDKLLTLDQRKVLSDFRIEIKKLEACKRQKRAPSAYNIFLGKCLRGEVSDVRHRSDAPQSDKMKACSVQWKVEKKK